MSSAAQKAVESGTRAGHAQVALWILFAIDGLTFGTWAALIPSFQQKFHLTTGQLSWALFGMVAGAMVSMPLAGRLIARWGSNRVAGPAALGFTAMLAGLALAPTYPAFIAAAVWFGLWKGAIDVSINSQAITVENARGIPILAGFQGFWSSGGLCAAAALSTLMKQGFAPSHLMIGMAVLLLTLSFLTLGRLLPDAADPSARPTTGEGKKPAGLWLIGALAFLALFSEGAMFDWSAVYARNIGGLSVALAPIGFAAFALCMATGRFLGDALMARIGQVRTMRLSGSVLVAGILVAVVLPHWLLILVGFGMVGFGTANIVPVIFGVAGRMEGHHTGSSLATVTTIGYLGFLAGPPLVGLIASEAGLPVALSLVIISGTIIATFGAEVVRKTANIREG
jgi:MFS family permease